MNQNVLGIIIALLIPSVFTLIFHFAVYDKIEAKKLQNILPSYKLDILPTYKPTISNILGLNE